MVEGFSLDNGPNGELVPLEDLIKSRVNPTRPAYDWGDFQKPGVDLELEPAKSEEPPKRIVEKEIVETREVRIVKSLLRDENGEPIVNSGIADLVSRTALQSPVLPTSNRQTFIKLDMNKARAQAETRRRAEVEAEAKVRAEDEARAQAEEAFRQAKLERERAEAEAAEVVTAEIVDESDIINDISNSNAVAIIESEGDKMSAEVRPVNETAAPSQQVEVHTPQPVESSIPRWTNHPWEKYKYNKAHNEALRENEFSGPSEFDPNDPTKLLSRPVRVEIEDLRTRAWSETSERVKNVLPRAILDSPAAKFIMDEAAVRASSRVVHESDTVEAEVVSRNLPRFESIHEYNVALNSLVASSEDFGFENVIRTDISPLEARQRTAKALSQSNHPAAQVPLEVVTNSKNDQAEVDAWQTVHLIEAESVNGGLVLGRSDTIGNLSRSNGNNQRTFLSTVNVIQDADDADVTLVAAFTPGRLPMPGNFDFEPEVEGQQDWGTLKIEAVAVNAAKFGLRVVNALNASDKSTVEAVGTGGAKKITEVRQRLNLTEAAEFIADKDDIGQIKPVVRYEGLGADRALPVSKANNDLLVTEAEPVEAEIVG